MDIRRRLFAWAVVSGAAVAGGAELAPPVNAVEMCEYQVCDGPDICVVTDVRYNCDVDGDSCTEVKCEIPN